MKSLSFLICSFALLLFSCKKETMLSLEVSHHFYVRNNNVDLPVLVEGNTASKTFVVYIHGGPEDGAIAESTNPTFWGKLEESYAMDYYGQRGIGMSNGNFDERALTIEQYVEDLDKILTVLKSRYGSDIGIFLLGGSWEDMLELLTLPHQTTKQK